MKYEEISPTMRAFLGGREAFRRMGFRAEDLFCEVAMSVRFGVLACFVRLEAQGKKFLLECGPVEDADAFGAEYARVALAVNGGTISEADGRRIWLESEPCQKKAAFTRALAARGFKPPRSLS